MTKIKRRSISNVSVLSFPKAENCQSPKIIPIFKISHCHANNKTLICVTICYLLYPKYYSNYTINNKNDILFINIMTVNLLYLHHDDTT